MEKASSKAQRRVWFLLVAIALLLTSQAMRQACAFPDIVRLTPGYVAELDCPLPVRAESSAEAAVAVSADETLGKRKLYLSGEREGSAEVTVRLLGIFPIKTVDVLVEDERRLMPGGQSVGVAIQLDGVLVVGMSDPGGTIASPARLAGIRAGDQITHVDGVQVENTDHLAELLTGGRKSSLTVRRNGRTLHVDVTPATDSRSGEGRLGIWARDSTAGVGTLSFYDPESGKWGALGHAINDIDTGILMPVGAGELVEAHVSDIRRGEPGRPGELLSSMESNPVALGNIERNGESGIYGLAKRAIVNPLFPEGLPIMLKSEVRTGKAEILTTLDDRGMRAYECEIVEVDRQPQAVQRGLTIRITDAELLERTGGIVQGMSGSPIIQDGKLVGAVTHVLVNDPTRGYGIFIENMLEAAG